MVNGRRSSGPPGLLARRAVGRVRRAVAPVPSVSAGIARLAAESPAPDAEDAPVFLLGAGWRTGSTYLQRMVNATPGTLVWGEPWTEGAIVARLAESLAFLDPRGGRSSGRPLPAGSPVPSAQEWTATMTPPTENILAAQRAMLDRLWRHPAAEHGCARWGVKENVWGRECLELLMLLYPGARFVLLVRDPVDQWRSYRPHTGRPWYVRFPEAPVVGPSAFGRMWDRLVRDFVTADRRSDRATIVRYEDLSSPGETARLTTFLGLDEPLRADLPRVGSSVTTPFFTEDLPAWETAILRRRTSVGRGLVGYP
ncbi:sulfotransferase family protein [Actinomycetospora aeridis]|uniref:Sulfotransferase n=1 Tax=Actinomycetospora aeridis TaxID=3129231 RepID=A0ABU8NAR8_9PSEU